MILSNVELYQALDNKRLIITPEPNPRHQVLKSDNHYCPYDTHAVDLTLGSEIVIPEPGTYAYDLTEPGLATFIHRNSKRVALSRDNPFVLRRNQFVLGLTRERVSLPIDHPLNLETKTCLAARIEGKSSRARVGLLIHFTAPTVHPGFHGTLTLEMINLGSASILLMPDMPIAQLIVEEVKGLPEKGGEKQFVGQTSPEGVVKPNAPTN